jgi:hypothetical protein
LIQNQLTDPDIQDCLYFQQEKQYSNACDEDRRRRLSTVEGKVFKDHQGTVWIQFPQQAALFCRSFETPCSANRLMTELPHQQSLQKESSPKATHGQA